MTDREMLGTILKVCTALRGDVGALSEQLRGHEQRDNDRFDSIRSDIQELKKVNNEIQTAETSAQLRAISALEARAVTEEARAHDWRKSLGIAIITVIFGAIVGWLSRGM